MQKDKDEMVALLKLLNLSDRVTYVRGDPAYAYRFEFLGVDPSSSAGAGGNSVLNILIIRSTWYGYPIALLILPKQRWVDYVPHGSRLTDAFAVVCVSKGQHSFDQ